MRSNNSQKIKRNNTKLKEKEILKVKVVNLVPKLHCFVLKQSISLHCKVFANTRHADLVFGLISL